MPVILFYVVMLSNVAKTFHEKTNDVTNCTGLCPYYKDGPSLDLRELVGSWVTAYTQPRPVKCFSLYIRSTTDLEREQCVMKYGNFSGRVTWEQCLLEVQSPLGKHYLQGTGRCGGVLDNIIISTEEGEPTMLQDESADQWALFGRRGSELLLMRDCGSEAAAIFARSAYWPSPAELFTVLHRSGVAPLADERVLCEPHDRTTRRYGKAGGTFTVSATMSLSAGVAALLALPALLLVSAGDCPAEREQALNDEAQLHNDLLCAYHSDFRPVKNHEKAVNIKVHLAPKYISFDTLEETITVQSMVVMIWQDEFLVWTPSNYGEIKETQFESYEIWTPGLTLYNEGAELYNSDSIDTKCQVASDGTVVCVPHLTYRGMCRTSLKHWPYDVENCTMYFGSWMYTDNQINFTLHQTNKQQPVDLDDYHNGPGWQLLNVVNDRVVVGKNDCCAILMYTFTLKREAAGLEAIVVVPFIAIVFLTLLSSILDVKDSKRLILVCFSLYVHYTFLIEIGYDIPRHSSDTPIILLLVRDSMIVTVVAILLTLLLMSLRRRVLPAPAWVVSVTRLVASGPGKYVVFTEFDPSAADGDDKRLTDDGAGSDANEARSRAAADWIQFANLLNSCVFIISLLIYLVLMFVYIPFQV